MPQISFGGANPAALGVPDLYINVQQPPAAALPGAPSTILGIVGSASWGPVNSPTVFGDEASGSAIFGSMQNRKYDLMTVAHAAVMQGANAFVGVRVTDGSDVAASVAVQTNCITLTAKYTGSRGNSLKAVIAAGTAANSWKVTLSLPGLQPETFDNITGSGNALWAAMAAAINNGQNAFRGPSQIVTATVGAGTTTPTAATVSLTGGADGATTITGTVLIGSDTSPRTGMYALRNTNAAVIVLADCDDSTTWTTQLAYAKTELCEAFCVSPSGDTLANFATTMNTAGVDDPWVKVIFGDWVYMLDGVNNVTRLVSPQGFLAGAKVVAGAANSVLNRSLYGVVGTQSSYANKTYSTADLISLTQSRGDVITSPSVGGGYFSARTGRNSSSDPGRHQDAYTTYTNYLARSMSASGGLGQFVGRLITPDQMREASASIGGFLQAEVDGGRAASFSVQIDSKNNPSSQIALGVEKATVLVKYQAVLEEFVVDLTGGQTVTPASALPLAA